MPPPKLVELRPDRTLLDSNFDGYKLSLSPISVLTKQLSVPVNRLVPDVNQYSLLHAKLYALHNHLTGTNTEEGVFYIDQKLNIQKVCLDSGEFNVETVWTIPTETAATSGDYNASMKFATPEIAVISDGRGLLYIVHEWTLKFSGDVTGSLEKFLITDVVHKEPHLHLLLTSVRQSKDRHCTILHWITFQFNETWDQVALRELTVNGFVQYANFERGCEAIYVVSDSGCKFTLDSEKQIEDFSEEAAKKYKWKQSNEDITLFFAFEDAVNRDLVEVVAVATKIEVKYRNEILLKGDLYKTIDPDVTTWTVEANSLEVALQKCETGLIWPEVVPGDVSGEFLADPHQVSEVGRLAPLTSELEVSSPSGATFNSQQVEDCDFECDKLTIFERLSISHDLTHKINLGSHQVLLTVSLDQKLPLALGVRNDVDICMWQPTIHEDFTLQHKGTLLAMGYIQASKQQMKFFTTSPDLSYSIISESTRHIFIYCHNKSVGCNELKNRATGRRVNTLAQQQVYSLPSKQEILGLFASTSHLYVLCEDFITALKL